MAGQSRAHLLGVLELSQVRTSRSADIHRVLVRVLVLNLAVALAKVGYGHASGAISILSDGFHSCTDAAANIVALVGIRAAHRPADRQHPYGHRKFETLASGGIFIFLLIALVEIAQSAIGHLRSGTAPAVSPAAFVLMIVTLGINLAVVRYESAASRRLSSELLAADSAHTQSDVLTSLAVLAALAGARLGFPLADPIAGLVVAGFVGHAGITIAKDLSSVLTDRMVLEEDDVRRVVLSVPDALGCHEIRTRGSIDHVFLDLHVWFRPELRLDEAHRLSHVVKDRLMAEFPELADVIIHLEPPPAPAGAR